MGSKQISVQRFSVTSSKKFEEVVAKLAAGVGHPDVRGMFGKIGTAKTYAEVEQAIQPGLGPTGLMEFMRFDHGEVVRKDRGEKTPRMARFLIGNPLVMKKMVEDVPERGGDCAAGVAV